jgi:hypothetical protein
VHTASHAASPISSFHFSKYFLAFSFVSKYRTAPVVLSGLIVIKANALSTVFSIVGVYRKPGAFIGV